MTHQGNASKTFTEELDASLRQEDARYVYADTATNAFVSAQIKALREERGLSQEDVAQMIGTKQSGVSRLERADYSAWKIETLRKVARAFGVRLRIRFEEFGTLIDEVGGFDKKSLAPRRFEDDPVFREPVRQEETDRAAAAFTANWWRGYSVTEHRGGKMYTALQSQELPRQSKSGIVSTVLPSEPLHGRLEPKISEFNAPTPIERHKQLALFSDEPKPLSQVLRGIGTQPEKADRLGRKRRGRQRAARERAA